MSARIITTEPSVEPVSLAEAKLYLRVTNDAQDDVITSLIEAARKYAELYCNRAFIDTVFDQSYDFGFPDVFYLTPVPVDSVTSITYLDEAGASQTLSSSLYRTDVASEPGRIEPAYGEVWPTTYPVINAVTVRFKSGYGTAGTDVPEGIRTAIKMLVGMWYEHREPVVTGTIATPIPMTVKALLDPFQLGMFAGSLP